MKYVVLTAKHCDGFLLWDSKVDGYNIMAHAIQAGHLRRVGARRCAKKDCGWAGIFRRWIGGTRISARSATPPFWRGCRVKLRELLSNYGQIGLMWFDWDGREPLYDQAGTYALVKKCQPQIIIDNRLDLGGGDNDRMIKSPLADYYTPEQQIGAYDDQRPWETCMTLGTQWSWKPERPDQIRRRSRQHLAHTAGGDGNLLLNVGPMPDGRIEPRQVAVLEQVGAWMKIERREHLRHTRRSVEAGAIPHEHTQGP